MANEKRGRHDGWTRGPAITLTGGATYYLPRVDAGLIPWIGKLRDDAVAVLMHAEGAAAGEVYADGMKAEDWLHMVVIGFAADLIQMQYRHRRSTVLDLLYRADRESIRLAIFAYLDEFVPFARSFPLGLGADLPSPVAN